MCKYYSSINAPKNKSFVDTYQFVDGTWFYGIFVFGKPTCRGYGKTQEEAKINAENAKSAQYREYAL